MHRPAPARFPIVRLPPLRLVLVALLAVAVGVSVHRTVSAASQAADALGQTRTVAVAQQFIAVGDEIQPADVSMVERPVAHVPDDAVVDDPTGRTVRVAVPAGEVVVAQRLAGEGRTGAAALVPEGWRAVAVPTIDAAAPVEPGDLVDVIASYDPARTATEPSRVIARDSVVVDVADDAVTVAVTPSRATAVAHALTNGLVTLALVG